MDKREHLEKEIERRLTLAIKEIGGTAYKFISPGNSGVPDRVIILPSGEVHFVEIKSKKGRLTPLQEIQIRRLKGLNAKVYVLYGLEEVKGYIESIKGA